jgi:hypothetical protein
VKINNVADKRIHWTAEQRHEFHKIIIERPIIIKPYRAPQPVMRIDQLLAFT